MMAGHIVLLFGCELVRRTLFLKELRAEHESSWLCSAGFYSDTSVV